jgi:hypothetical protein
VSRWLFAGLPESTLLLGNLEGFQGAGGGCGGGLAALHFGAFEVVAGKELEGQFAVGFGSAGLGVVEGHRFAVTRGFGEADVAGDGGLEEFVVEEGLEVVGDLLGEVGAVVEHGEEDAFEGERGVEGLGDAVEGGHELGDAFEGKVLGLHGDEKTVGGDEGVEGEEIEGWGAVEEDEGVIGPEGGEGLAEFELAAFEGDELDGGADEVFAAGNELEVVDFGGEEGFGDGGMAEEDVVDAEAGFVSGEAEASGGVGLGVAVDEEGGEAFEGDGGGQVDGGGGFADSPFLVNDGDDLRRGRGGRGFGVWLGGDHRRKEKGIGRCGSWQCGWAVQKCGKAVEKLSEAGFSREIEGISEMGCGNLLFHVEQFGEELPRLDATMFHVEH